VWATGVIRKLGVPHPPASEAKVRAATTNNVVNRM
jgi:hypothetical protein